MDYFRIQGGTVLDGKVRIRGAKNSALELIAASILTDEPVVLRNVPSIADIGMMVKLVENHGARAEWDKPAHTLRLHTPKIKNAKAPYEIVSKMRASIYILGALLGRHGEAKVSLPGGCALGPRPLDIHLRAMESLGAKVEIHHGYIVAAAPKGGLKGARIDGLVKMAGGIPVSTHGGNVNAIEAAVLAKGETTIRHATLEPEVDDLIGMLNAMGAKIRRAKDGAVDLIIIEGVEKLHGVEYSVMPDRMEAATYAAAAAITRGRIECVGADTSKMGAVLEVLEKAGVKIDPTKDGFIADAHGARLRAVDVVSRMYPGVPTDTQPQLMAVLATAKGVSTVRELIFENRFMYAPELERMGADIEVVDGQVAEFRGTERLFAADVMAADIRSGAALTLAGMAADGETVLHRVYHIYRGYENFVENLNALGAEITVEKEAP